MELVGNLSEVAVCGHLPEVIEMMVVVKDEIQQGVLVEYLTLPNIYENFYAVTVRRQYVPALLGELLKAAGPGTADSF